MMGRVGMDVRFREPGKVKAGTKKNAEDGP
jgi:hypothetical protein